MDFSISNGLIVNLEEDWLKNEGDLDFFRNSLFLCLQFVNFIRNLM